MNFVLQAQQVNPTIKKSTDSTIINGKKYFLHTVQDGESLYAIAKTYQVQIKDIIAANPDAIDGISPNDVLKIPASQINTSTITVKLDSSAYTFHTVVHGETLYSLSKQGGMSVSEFTELNPESKNGLKTGEIVKIPHKESPEKMSETEMKNANPAVKKYVSESSQKITEPAVTIEKMDTTAHKVNFPKDGYFNIALFLPFNLDGIDSINVDAIARGNSTFPPRTKIALNFYEGALMAIDSLEKQGFKCHVFVYSLDENDSSKRAVKKIFFQPEFSTMNLIIGPLYSVAFNTVEKLAKEKNIPIVSPFIQQNKILLGYSNAFKAAPSGITQLDALATYAAENDADQNIIIIKNDNNQNNTNADLFKNKFSSTLKNTHAEINVANFISKDFSGVKKYFSGTKKNVVVMLSQDQAYVTNFLNSLENESGKDSVILLCLHAVQGFDNLDLTYLNNLQFHFPANYFVNYSDNNTKIFIENYREKYLTDPDRYVYQGFDVTYYCLTALKNYGTDFMEELPQIKMQGIQTSFDFYKTSLESGYENKAVYILEYKNFEIIKATK
ncbi:MAG: LysM peptidoglycan-binding domain-containing protein [Bacteroidia bacterium]